MFLVIQQRSRTFKERISIDALEKVRFDDSIRDKEIDAFTLCCRHMEGHLHSDKYAAKKPSPESLHEEIQRFITTRQAVRDAKGKVFN